MLAWRREGKSQEDEITEPHSIICESRILTRYQLPVLLLPGTAASYSLFQRITTTPFNPSKYVLSYNFTQYYHEDPSKVTDVA